MNKTNQLIEKVVNGEDPYVVIESILFENWKKTSDGYEGVFNGNKAIIKKEKKKWFLIFKGKKHSMPKRPSFDHAEGIIKQELNL
jgi:hypothetical protein